MPPLQHPPDQIPGMYLGDLLDSLSRQSHAGSALLQGAIVENSLLIALKSKMIPLNSDLNHRLFRGYGPLHTFSAKIDLAYVLQIIDETTYKDTGLIKSIRNKFAHMNEPKSFQSPDVIDLCRKFSFFSGEPFEPFGTYSFAVNKVLQVISAYSKKTIAEITEDVRAALSGKSPPSSPPQSTVPGESQEGAEDPPGSSPA